MQEVNKNLIEEALKELTALEWNDGRINRVIKGLKQALAPESELYYNQQVLVSDGDNRPKIRALFQKYEDGVFVVDTVDDSRGSAHPNNWYCPECAKEKSEARTKIPEQRSEQPHAQRKVSDVNNNRLL